MFLQPNNYYRYDTKEKNWRSVTHRIDDVVVVDKEKWNGTQLCMVYEKSILKRLRKNVNRDVEKILRGDDKIDLRVKNVTGS